MDHSTVISNLNLNSTLETRINITKEMQNGSEFTTPDSVRASINQDINTEILTTVEKIFYTGVSPVVIPTGIIGNILTMIVLCRIKPKQTTTILLMALAIADLFVLGIFGSSLFILNFRIYTPEFGKKIQVLAVPLFYVYIFPLPGRFENLLIATIAFERIFAVARPLQVRQIWTKGRVVIIISVLFLANLLLNLPLAFMYELMEVTTKSGESTLVPKLTEFGKRTDIFDPYYIFTESVLIFIPILFVIISTIVISCILCISGKRRESMTGRGKTSNELQITVTLMAVSGVFIVCKLPGTISRLLIMFDPKSQQHQTNNVVYSIVSILSFVLVAVNSSVNFIIYAITSEKYRTGYIDLLCRKKPLMKSQTEIKGSTSVGKRVSPFHESALCKFEG